MTVFLTRRNGKPDYTATTPARQVGKRPERPFPRGRQSFPDDEKSCKDIIFAPPFC